MFIQKPDIVKLQFEPHETVNEHSSQKLKWKLLRFCSVWAIANRFPMKLPHPQRRKILHALNISWKSVGISRLVKSQHTKQWSVNKINFINLNLLFLFSSLIEMWKVRHNLKRFVTKFYSFVEFKARKVGESCKMIHYLVISIRYECD